MIELTLPAGSYDAAIEAFNGGADGVYLGLKEFSARKSAKNFSFEELSRLRSAAQEYRKTVYVAVNTILQDTEIESLVPTLRRLCLLNLDGIIVQDLGLAHLIATRFPSIPLHASTQLAVHSSDGVRALGALGFSRVVLSRELTLEEIRTIREEVPDVELKVFIHGAMCYGFSGLCMASSLLTDRSANKGECSQICRTWFEDESGREGFFFSMKDLSSDAQTLRELERIGIDSLKVEGRMKSPGYAAAAARHYRTLLMRDVPDAETAKQLSTAFSRESSAGWLGGYDKHRPKDIRHTPSLITQTYTGHRGIPAGTILSHEGHNRWKVFLREDIHLRDGLLILRKRVNQGDEVFAFGAKELTDSRGLRVTTLKRGSSGYLIAPPELAGAENLELRIISRHDATLRSHEPGSFKMYRYPITLDITIERKRICIEGKGLPPFLAPIPPFCREIDIQEAQSEQKTDKRIRNAFGSTQSPYLTGAEVTVTYHTDLPASSLFIPASSLKTLRNQWYEMIDSMIERAFTEQIQEYPTETPKGRELPPRHRISPTGNTPLPFADLNATARALERGDAIEEILAVVDGSIYLPLPPVFFDEHSQKMSLDGILKKAGNRILVGINNPAHLIWMTGYPEVSIFADIYLYIANRWTAQSLLQISRAFVGGYSWIERKTDTADFPLLLSETGDSFTPPLFLSRSCYRYDVLGLGCEGCTRRFTYHVTQQKRQYRVDVRECMTTVTAQSTP